MRFEIAKGGSGLTYDIRGIVPLANKIKELRFRDHSGEHRRSY